MQSRIAPSPHRRFVTWVMLLAAGLVAAAALTAWLLDLSFGMTLLIMGAIVSGAGAYLGAPDPTDPDNPRNIPFAFLITPNKHLEDQEDYDAEHTVPAYAWENVLMDAGLLVVLLSLPFLAYTLLAK